MLSFRPTHSGEILRLNYATFMSSSYEVPVTDWIYPTLFNHMKHPVNTTRGNPAFNVVTRACSNLASL